MNRGIETFKRKRKGSPIGDLNTKNCSSGIIAGIFVITGPSALILEAASNGNFTNEQTFLWMFSVYVFGGILGIILPLYYKIPIVGGHSLTGVAFLATMTHQFTFHELIGAYMLSGIVMLLIGSIGVFTKLINLVPKAIISAMLAGMITKYMVNFVVSINELLLVGLASLVTFFLLSRWQTRVPPVIAAIVVGFMMLILFYPLSSPEVTTGAFLPQFQVPEFNIVSFISISIPLALIILSNDAAVAIGALEQNNYRAPVNKLISVGGLFSILSSLFGGQSANVAGMATVICSGEDAGPKEKRYMGAIVAGILLFIFGLLSWKLIPLIQTLPNEFISIIVGFSLLGVFGNSLNQSFSTPSMKISTAFAYIIALSNISIFNISAPLCSLLVGTLIARYIEKASLNDAKQKGKRTA